jgi:hypothetical protein
MTTDSTCQKKFRRKAAIVPLIFSAIVAVASPAAAQVKDDHSQSTNDRGCSQQERSNETVGEKLNQTTGTICPPDIAPPVTGTTRPNATGVVLSPESPHPVPPK